MFYCYFWCVFHCISIASDTKIKTFLFWWVISQEEPAAELPSESDASGATSFRQVWWNRLVFRGWMNVPSASLETMMCRVSRACLCILHGEPRRERVALHLHAGDALEGGDRKPVDHKTGDFLPLRLKWKRKGCTHNTSEKENLT